MGNVIDLSQSETKDFEPIPGGHYMVAITDGEVRESGPEAKYPGSEYIAWEFTVQSGEHENRKLWTNTSLLPQALFGLKGLIAANPESGLDPNATALDTGEIIPALLGCECVAVVQLKPKKAEYASFPGEKQNNIRGFKKSSEYQAPKASGGAANSLLP